MADPSKEGGAIATARQIERTRRQAGAADLYQAVIAEADCLRKLRPEVGFCDHHDPRLQPLDASVRAVEAAAEGVFQLALRGEEAGKTL